MILLLEIMFENKCTVEIDVPLFQSNTLTYDFKEILQHVCKEFRIGVKEQANTSCAK
jgi:hypothetical protein